MLEMLPPLKMICLESRWDSWQLAHMGRKRNLAIVWWYGATAQSATCNKKYGATAQSAQSVTSATCERGGDASCALPSWCATCCLRYFLSNCIIWTLCPLMRPRLMLYNIQPHYEPATRETWLCEIERNWTRLKYRNLSLILCESGNTSESKSWELLWMGPEIDFEKKW